MSELILNSEYLNQILDGKIPAEEKTFEIFQVAEKDSTELFKVAQFLREKHKGNMVTFSKKAFFNIVNLCRDICSYCTYKAEPNETKLSMMDKKDVLQLIKLAKKYKCIEALFVTGERPEEKYEEARSWLKVNGFKM